MELETARRPLLTNNQNNLALFGVFKWRSVVTSVLRFLMAILVFSRRAVLVILMREKNGRIVTSIFASRSAVINNT